MGTAQTLRLRLQPTNNMHCRVHSTLCWCCAFSASGPLPVGSCPVRRDRRKRRQTRHHDHRRSRGHAPHGGDHSHLMARMRDEDPIERFILYWAIHLSVSTPVFPSICQFSCRPRKSPCSNTHAKTLTTKQRNAPSRCCADTFPTTTEPFLPKGPQKIRNAGPDSFSSTPHDDDVPILKD